MTVPGGNLLALALSVQGTQIVKWYRNTGRTTNAVGKDVAEYADPVDVRGSFQPMNRAQVMRNGFDLQKTYATLYGSEPFKPMGRDLSGDKFTFSGSKYQAVTDIDWTAQDSWDAVTLVRVGPDA